MARKEIAFGNRLSDKSKSPEQTLRAKYDIRPLRLDSIYPSSSNKYSKDSIEELAVSMSIIGLQHFITVKPADGDGQYQITDGERRYLAHRYLVEESGEEDFSLIMGRITAEESDAIADYRMHSGNGTKRDFTDADRVLYASEMRRLYEQLRFEGKIQGGRIRDYVAKKLKVSPAQVAIYNKIEHNLNPELWKRFAQVNSLYQMLACSRRWRRMHKSVLYASWKRRGILSHCLAKVNTDQLQSYTKS